MTTKGPSTKSHTTHLGDSANQQESDSAIHLKLKELKELTSDYGENPKGIANYDALALQYMKAMANADIPEAKRLLFEMGAVTDRVKLR